MGPNPTLSAIQFQRKNCSAMYTLITDFAAGTPPRNTIAEPFPIKSDGPTNTAISPASRNSSLPANPEHRNFWNLLSNRAKVPDETYDYVYMIVSAPLR